MKFLKIPLFLFILLTFWDLHSTGAQVSNNEWSEPKLIFSTAQGQKTNELWVLSDRAGILYAWWPLIEILSDGVDGDDSETRTLHTQMIDRRWLSPMDVMVWPDAGRLTSVIIDSFGKLYAFSATDCLSYVTAENEKAISARSWGKRICLDNTGLANPSVVQTTNGVIFVAYVAPGNQAFRLIQSQDGGVTWSANSTITEINEDFLLDPALSLDQKGRLHLVWSVGQAPNAYPPIGVFYSRSNDGGISWTVPIKLGGEDEGQPAIAVNNDEVHVLWNGDASKRGRYYRYSGDAGDNWGPVEVLSPPSSLGGKGGLQRPPGMIIDNTGVLHVLLHEQDELFYSSKSNQGWTEKVPLYIPEFMEAVEIYAVRLAITGGNEIHAFYTLDTYFQNTTENRNEHSWKIYHQSRRIDAIPMLPIAWPTPINGEEADDHSMVMVTQDLEKTSQPSPDGSDNITPLYNDYNPAYSIIVSILSVFFFIGLVIFGFILFRKR
jgi:hypothetical protein